MQLQHLHTADGMARKAQENHDRIARESEGQTAAQVEIELRMVANLISLANAHAQISIAAGKAGL